MDATFEQRLARVIGRRQDELTAIKGTDAHPDRERRLAHARVVSELPRLMSKLSRVIEELNDQIMESDILIKVDAGEHTPNAEAIYTFSVVGPDQEGPVLVLNIDYLGKLRAMLCSNQTRSLIESSTIFAIDRAGIMALMIALLESYYH